VLHRQRRGGVGGQAVRRNRRAGKSGCRGALAPAHQRSCPLILPFHAALDIAREAAREQGGTEKIGTTGRGIGPAYEDKIARRALRVQDLKHPERFAAKLRELLALHNHVLTTYLGSRFAFPIAGPT
jgi:adenylosuccinate synthase